MKLNMAQPRPGRSMLFWDEESFGDTFGLPLQAVMERVLAQNHVPESSELWPAILMRWDHLRRTLRMWENVNSRKQEDWISGLWDRQWSSVIKKICWMYGKENIESVLREWMGAWDDQSDKGPSKYDKIIFLNNLDYVIVANMRGLNMCCAHLREQSHLQ